MLLGDRIRQLREAKGFSQSELAGKAGCTQQTIAKIEINKSLKPQNLPNIAKALGVSTEDVLREVDAPGKRKAQAPPNRVKRSRSRWPFNFPFELYDNLSKEDQLEISTTLFAAINKIKARNAAAHKGGKDRAEERETKSRIQ